MISAVHNYVFLFFFSLTFLSTMLHMPCHILITGPPGPPGATLQHAAWQHQSAAAQLGIIGTTHQDTLLVITDHKRNVYCVFLLQLQFPMVMLSNLHQLHLKSTSRSQTREMRILLCTGLTTKELQCRMAQHSLANPWASLHMEPTHGSLQIQEMRSLEYLFHTRLLETPRSSSSEVTSATYFIDYSFVHVPCR